MTEEALASVLKENGLEKPPSILMVAAECVPFAKTGGLADVAGTLAAELKQLGFDVRVAMPYHRIVKEKLHEQALHLKSFSVDLGWRSQYAGVETLEYNGVPYYFIDNEYYFGYEIYKGGHAEGEQYAYFCRAVLEALPLIGFIPDIIQVNDWHTAIIPMLIKTQYADKPQGGIRSVLTMHSLMYQGKFDFPFISDLLGIDVEYYKPEYIENYGCANLLKAGIVFADKLTTVSPSYAEEMKTDYYGEGLNGIISARYEDLAGIVNGIDTNEFNPEKDALIQKSYSIDDLTGKKEDKTALALELGLAIAEDTPLISMVSRLTAQKGLDLIMHVFDELMQGDAGFIVLGSGDWEYEEFFRHAQGRYAGRMAAVIKYDNALAHRIYAGSDFLLMPSRFEPCGISQMIAMRYGTLPVVRATGGLRDTVQPYNSSTGEGTGFSFDHYNAHDMLNTVRFALDVFRDEENHRKLVQNAMRKDVSFKTSAKAYARLFINMMQ